MTPSTESMSRPEPFPAVGLPSGSPSPVLSSSDSLLHPLATHNLPRLPSSSSRRRRSLWALAGLLLLGSIAGTTYYYTRPEAAPEGVLLYTVKKEFLQVTVVEKGTLESADNRDLVCRVRAGSRGYATSINWVIEDGARVCPGQLLMILDDSALKEQEDNQSVVVKRALAAKVKAEKDYEIQPAGSDRTGQTDRLERGPPTIAPGGCGQLAQLARRRGRLPTTTG